MNDANSLVFDVALSQAHFFAAKKSGRRGRTTGKRPEGAGAELGHIGGLDSISTGRDAGVAKNRSGTAVI
jgi:hypothetical protein